LEWRKNFTESWVRQTITPPSANKLKNYGYQSWLNGFVSDTSSQHIFPDVPAEMFYCDGYAYQFIFIISKKLVVVRLGLTFDENAFLKDIIEPVDEMK
jgi:hypothetical protein